MPTQPEDNGGSSGAYMPLYLWLARPNELKTADDLDDGHVLSNEENARLRAFRFERDRRQYLTTRLLVRNALSHYHPNPPHAWRFQTNSYGKPALDPDCGLRFNLSNSPELVVCLIGRGVELGVDAEPLTRASQTASVSSEFLSALEAAQLEALSDEERLSRTLSLWTLKEAYIKARGLGLSLPLQGISFAFEAQDEIRMNIHPSLNDDASNWRFSLMDLAGHRIALFAKSKSQPQLEIWKAQPLVAPIRVRHDETVWFPGPRSSDT